MPEDTREIAALQRRQQRRALGYMMARSNPMPAPHLNTIREILSSDCGRRVSRFLHHVVFPSFVFQTNFDRYISVVGIDFNDSLF